MRFAVYHWSNPSHLPNDWAQNQIVELLPEDVIRLSEDFDVQVRMPPPRREFERYLLIDDRGRNFRVT